MYSILVVLVFLLKGTNVIYELTCKAGEVPEKQKVREETEEVGEKERKKNIIFGMLQGIWPSDIFPFL